MFNGDRYITRGVIGLIDNTIIHYLWYLLDQLGQSNKTSLDYLQIFELKTIKTEINTFLQIHHHQEVPQYENQTTIKLNKEVFIDEKIYIIHDVDEEGKDYATMLLASEY